MVSEDFRDSGSQDEIPERRVYHVLPDSLPFVRKNSRRKTLDDIGA